MLINVCIIKAGGMMGATPQKYTRCLSVAALQKLYPVWILSGQNLSFRNELLKIPI